MYKIIQTWDMKYKYHKLVYKRGEELWMKDIKNLSVIKVC